MDENLKLLVSHVQQARLLLSVYKSLHPGVYEAFIELCNAQEVIDRIVIAEKANSDDRPA